jgi:hypothetical protein
LTANLVDKVKHQNGAHRVVAKSLPQFCCEQKEQSFWVSQEITGVRFANAHGSSLPEYRYYVVVGLAINADSSVCFFGKQRSGFALASFFQGPDHKRISGHLTSAHGVTGDSLHFSCDMSYFVDLLIFDTLSLL